MAVLFLEDRAVCAPRVLLSARSIRSDRQLRFEGAAIAGLTRLLGTGAEYSTVPEQTLSPRRGTAIKGACEYRCALRRLLSRATAAL